GPDGGVEKRIVARRIFDERRGIVAFHFIDELLCLFAGAEGADENDIATVVTAAGRIGRQRAVATRRSAAGGLPVRLVGRRAGVLRSRRTRTDACRQVLLYRKQTSPKRREQQPDTSDEDGDYLFVTHTPLVPGCWFGA